jgi:hypothetical protein
MFDTAIKGRISPFLPQNYIDKGRILSLLMESFEMVGDIQISQGDLNAEEINDYETQVHRNVQEIALALTGKKYIVKKEKE